MDKERREQSAPIELTNREAVLKLAGELAILSFTLALKIPQVARKYPIITTGVTAIGVGLIFDKPNVSITGVIVATIGAMVEYIHQGELNPEIGRMKLFAQQWWLSFRRGKTHIIPPDEDTWKVK